jgi:putative methyltransferase (TIGR04325 family)
MTLRALVKYVVTQFAPPVLLTCLDRLGIIRKRRIWSGVYRRFADVPTTGEGFSGERWRALVAEDLRRIREAESRNRSAFDRVDEESALLSIVGAMVQTRRGGKLRVLDFGGGAGITYASLLTMLVEHAGLDYHIVELPWACEIGARAFKDDPRIHFHTSLPDDLPHIDLLHVSGVLENLEDYGATLRTLCARRASYILLTSLFAGDFQPFVTMLHNIPGSTAPFWFLNTREVIDTIEGCGYRLLFRAPLQAVYDQDNFVPELRLPGDRASVLLFARST